MYPDGKLGSALSMQFAASISRNPRPKPCSKPYIRHQTWPYSLEPVETAHPRGILGQSTLHKQPHRRRPGAQALATALGRCTEYCPVSWHDVDAARGRCDATVRRPCYCSRAIRLGQRHNNQYTGSHHLSLNLPQDNFVSSV